MVVSSILRTSKLGKVGVSAAVKESGGGAELAGTCVGGWLLVSIEILPMGQRDKGWGDVPMTQRKSGYCVLERQN